MLIATITICTMLILWALVARESFKTAAALFGLLALYAFSCGIFCAFIMLFAPKLMTFGWLVGIPATLLSGAVIMDGIWYLFRRVTFTDEFFNCEVPPTLEQLAEAAAISKEIEARVKAQYN